MPDLFSHLDLGRIKKLANFKINYSNVHVLEHIDQTGRKPLDFKEYKKGILRVPFQSEEMPRPVFSADLAYLRAFTPLHYPKGRMLILVNWDLYANIRTSLEQYVVDLARDGFYGVIYRMRGGLPSDIRDFLRGHAPRVGALLVGRLPVAWFEMPDDFFGASEFPCDLYYMDLDGTWTDVDADGKFGAHPTNVKPEIFIGRLWTPTADGNDAALLRDYFARNHQFRTGQLGAVHNALAYVDDDWAGFGDCGLDLMFPAGSIQVFTDPTTTDGDRYRAEIHENRAWAQVCAHSSPSGHSFKVPGAASEWVPASYLRDVNPPNALFYNLFACSNARFVEADYMAGWYIFARPGGSTAHGLVALGSTKTGSMLAFENFYGPMGRGEVIGEAYRDWWNALGTDHDLSERQWFYGMTLLGDPTLNWWSGAVPITHEPSNGEKFEHYPRLTHYRWDALDLPNVRYTIEIDAFGAGHPGWAEATGGSGLVVPNLTETKYEAMFVGAQRGRWRVRATSEGRTFPWSAWSYFSYTK